VRARTLNVLTVLIALTTLTTEASAQSRTFFDGTTGKVTARSVTGSNGAVTLYGADG
jgi:hypothetical protein